MKRPSRGERWSAATTRQTGLLVAPTRVSLIFTAMRRLTLQAAAHQLLHGGHLALLERAHHLLHLAELLDELVHGLDARPGAGRDPLAARSIDHLRIAALGRRHRGHDRLDPVQLALVDPRRLELLQLHEAGQHAQQVADRAHAPDLLHLIEEIVKAELLLADLAL